MIGGDSAAGGKRSRVRASAVAFTTLTPSGAAYSDGTLIVQLRFRVQRTPCCVVL